MITQIISCVLFFFISQMPSFQSSSFATLSATKWKEDREDNALDQMNNPGRKYQAPNSLEGDDPV